MIHHAITYLEMSSYARYLTQQTTTTEEITFTVETSAILNSSNNEPDAQVQQFF